MRRRIHDDGGAVTVIVAVVMACLIGLAAVAVDQGYLFDTRHQLQAAADAGALAGCSTLIETHGGVSEADAAARDFATRNASGAGVGLAVDSVTIDTASEPWSVRVQVSRPVPAWFTGIFGVQSSTVHAAAKAEKQPLTGASRVMPWGIPIIKDEDVEDVRAVVVDSHGTALTSSSLGHSGIRYWSGSVPAPAAAGGYDVRIAIDTRYPGGRIVTEWVGDSKGAQAVGRIIVPPATYPFSSIIVSNDFGANDEPFSATVQVRTAAPETRVVLTVDKKTFPLAGDGTNWSVAIPSSSLSFDDGFLNTFPVDISVGGGKGDGQVDAYLHVRRSTYPVSGVALSSTITSPGVGVGVEMRLNDFDPMVLVPGQVYTIRVGSDGVETGNFGEINFNGIVHHAGCSPDPEGVSLGNNVRDWVQDGYGGALHIGDVLPVSPGKSGWTSRVVEERIEKYGNVIIVPIVAKYEDKGGGSYDVIVRAFGAFRVLSLDRDCTITGEFIEYVATPSSYGTPGGPATVYQARLVNP